jgi:hypothetical protein
LPVAACLWWGINFWPAALLGAGAPQFPALPVDLVGSAGWLRIGIRFGLAAALARTIGNQEGTELRGHVAAGRVMLPQEAR